MASRHKCISIPAPAVTPYGDKPWGCGASRNAGPGLEERLHAMR